jgi:hypothetical protein
MKRAFSVIAAGTMLFSVLGIVVAQAAGPPEVDRADATFSLTPKGAPVAKPCMGDDTGIIKLTGTWKGSETDFTPVPGYGNDENLTGTLSVKNAVFTINATNGVGVGTATVQLNNSAGAMVYKGKFNVVTQQNSPQTGMADGRGMVIADFYNAAGGKDGNTLFANFELTLNTTSYAITGSFGGDPTLPPAEPVVHDWSAVWSNTTC